MGVDIGMVFTVAAVDPTILLDSARSTWPEAGNAVVVATRHGPLGLGSDRPIHVLTISVMPVQVAMGIALDPVARVLSTSMDGPVAAAFMASHYLLGGYVLFEHERTVESELMGADEYVDGTRRALERLTSHRIDVERRDRLFFTERWVFDHCEGPEESFLLACDGRWLDQPTPITMTEDQKGELTYLYIVDIPDLPTTVLRDPGWREVVQRWAEEQTAQGSEAYLREGGYELFSPHTK